MDIDSEDPKPSHELIQSWLAKHKFWYEDLPNRIYEECLLTSSALPILISKNALILAVITWALCFNI